MVNLIKMWWRKRRIDEIVEELRWIDAGYGRLEEREAELFAKYKELCMAPDVVKWKEY